MNEHVSEMLSELAEWVVSDALPELAHKAPEVEAKDGQEPNAEFMRELARQADARAKSEKPRALTSHDRKAIDKEFWDSM